MEEEKLYKHIAICADVWRYLLSVKGERALQMYNLL